MTRRCRTEQKERAQDSSGFALRMTRRCRPERREGSYDSVNMAEIKKETDPYKKPERKKLLDVDGGFMTFMTKAGELIILTLVWMVSLIPVVTVIGATTSLYYAIVKNIRRSRSYPFRLPRRFARGLCRRLAAQAVRKAVRPLTAGT